MQIYCDVFFIVGGGGVDFLNQKKTSESKKIKNKRKSKRFWTVWRPLEMRRSSNNNNNNDGGSIEYDTRMIFERAINSE